MSTSMERMQAAHYVMHAVDRFWAQTGEPGTFDEYMKKDGVGAFTKMIDKFSQNDMRPYTKRFFAMYFPQLSDKFKQELAWLFAAMAMDYDHKYGELSESDIFNYLSPLLP